MPASGILIINKPAGKTSRWVTNQVSRLLREKKAGHLGTLDPIATGVLPVALGNATRVIRFLESDDKVYRGVIRLGAATDTQDAAGRVVAEGDWRAVTPHQAAAVLATFQGELVQIPPMHSALKQGGVPLYRLARRGIEVERVPRKVRIFSITVESIELPDLVARVRCAPGLYMRTLAHDFGLRLGCQAHLAGLTRVWSGPFSLDQAVDLEGLDPETATERLLPLALCLPHFPGLELDQSQWQKIRDGISIPGPETADPGGPAPYYRLIYRGELAAVAAGVRHGTGLLLRPLRVLANP